MSDSENESYTSDHNENIENIEKPISFKNHTGRNSPVYEEPEKPVKSKRVMSEKQLENLKKARLIAHAKLKDKKKETQLMKKKEQELKILKKLDKNITVDKKIKDLKNKIVYTPKDNKEDEIFYLQAEPRRVYNPKKPSKQRAILQAEKSKKKKIVYITDSESEEEIIYLKKPKPRTKAQPKQPKQPKQPEQQFIEDLDEQEKIEKETQDKIVEKHYNDKIALIKREYLMKSVFQP
jgi:ribonuclease BN (tRNA processing enzyme)